METAGRSWILGTLAALALGGGFGLACSSSGGDEEDMMEGGDSGSGGTSAFGGNATGGTGNPTGGTSNPTGGTSNPTAGTSGGGVPGGGGSGGAGDDMTPRCTATLTLATGTCNIIDDFEDGMGATVGGRACPPGDGRGPGGSWDVVRPITLVSTYEFTPVQAGAPGSTQGVHWTATGVDANQGASIGLSFGPCYGAAPTYTGFTFWAQAAAQVDMIVGVNDALSHGEVDCHGADSSTEPGMDACYGSFRKTVTVTPTWQQFTVTWDELVQASWGTPKHPLEPNKLVSLVFIFLADFDVTLDDIAFVGGDASMCGAPPVGNGGAGGTGAGGASAGEGGAGGAG